MMYLFEKFKKSLKICLRSCTRCNWPELSRYCGCCELSTGIYIRCVLTAVTTAVTFVFNCILLISLLHARTRIQNADASTLEELLGEGTADDSSDATSTDLSGVFMVLNGVAAYFLLWSIFKIFYILRNIWTIYAVYKKNRFSLKVLLYIGVPCWIFEVFFLFIATILLGYLFKALILFNFMFEGYNLLAIHSKYKEISGKSRIVKDFGMNSEIHRPHRVNDETAVDTENRLHCITCKCYLIHDENNCVNDNVGIAVVPPVTAEPTVADMWLATANTQTPETKDKSEYTLNFKDSPIIYNQEILQGSHSVVNTPTEDNDIRDIPRGRPQRPTTLAIRPVVIKEEKTDLCDTAVIYDDTQFNVGTSPIIES